MERDTVQKIDVMLHDLEMVLSESVISGEFVIVVLAAGNTGELESVIGNLPTDNVLTRINYHGAYIDNIDRNEVE